MTRPRGTSLVELLVIMSAASVILSTSAVIIHRTMRAQSQTRYFFENERAAQRLARQFRADVRATVPDSLRELESVLNSLRDSQTPNDATEPFLTLELPAAERTNAITTVEYRRTTTGVLRISRRPDVPEAREEYALASIAKLDLHEEAAPRRLVLTIAADPADLNPPRGEPTPTIRDTPVNMQVVAVVGRDTRFVPATADASSSNDTAEDASP